MGLRIGAFMATSRRHWELLQTVEAEGVITQVQLLP
jgi:hypothetical protein